MTKQCIICSSSELPIHSVETEDSRYCLDCDPDYYCSSCYKDYLKAVKEYRSSPDNWSTCHICGITDITVKERQDPEEGTSGQYRDTCDSCHTSIVDSFCEG